MSALLHALVTIVQEPFLQSQQGAESEDEDAPLPVTSYTCQWVQPRKRKESTAKVSETSFMKHVYGRTRKHELAPISNFDPRPPEYRGTMSTRVPAYLEKVKGLGIGYSVLTDTSLQIWSDDSTESTVDLPTKTELSQRVSLFIESLHLSPERIREIERNTTQQHLSPQWFSVRRYRLTASMFGEVLRRRPDTPPDALVLRIIEPKQFTSAATEWGKETEAIALQEYEVNLKSLGHSDITVCRAGFVVCESHPFLGASPDGYVHDPSRKEQYGLVEIKCPYKYREVSVEDACKNSDFCSNITTDDNGMQQINLKRSHPYFAQVQGQLAISGRGWCDFVLYTTKGIVVETIKFDEQFWNVAFLY